MGKIGLNASVAVVAAANLLLFSALMMQWKHISFFAGAVTADIYLISVSFSGAVSSTLMAALPSSVGLSDDDLTGNMTMVRDIFCGIPVCQFCSAMCEKFTIDLACGVTTVCMFMLSIIISSVACGYLCYHLIGVAKREYRVVAYRCLCVAPVVTFIGFFAQIVALFFALSNSLRIGQGASFPSVITPAGGYFASIIAFFLLCFVPCLHAHWVMPTKELVNDEERRLRHEQRDQLVDANPFDYGATGNDSRAFYAPSKFGSLAYYQNDEENMNNNHHSGDHGMYPSLAQPHNTFPEPHHQFTAQVYTPFACAPPQMPETAYIDRPNKCPPASAPDSHGDLHSDECPPGYEQPASQDCPPGFNNALSRHI
eukprot:GEMP01019882.1.p1 GENE.GEMP01019882.1~~GEMP01019882.1.p1  ORF type:complete len:369 (+),score=82.80 GEMP01019882.1:103-1209(+)